ncbi:MAG: hypothetical protein IH991_19000, partial [Planctomycetes bacterium]|nr:hypothetical protein [Planctomycetota bacterium]
MSKAISRISMTRWTLTLASVVVACLLAATRTAVAEEPAQDFLEGLRERGYFDTAIEYLDSVKDSKFVTPSFKRTIAYEKGVTLVQGAHFVNDPVLRGKQLDEAQVSLQDFVKTQKTHKYYCSAQNQLANLLVQRAVMNLEKANKKTTPPNEKTMLLADARTKYGEAKNTFEATRIDLKTRLESIRKNLNPENPAEKRLIEIRDRYRTDYLQARLMLPAVQEELADTYPNNEEKRKELLLAAAKEYDGVYQDYRTRVAGLYARMYQGRCYKKIKDYKEALSYFDDLLDNPNEPEAFRTLKLKELTLAVDNWLQPDQNKYMVAIKKLDDILKVVKPFESKHEEWLYLRLNLAKARIAAAQDLEKKPNKNAEDRRQITINYNLARKEATLVSRVEKSDYQRPARELLAQIKGDTLAPETRPEPTTFAEARLAGKEALDEVQTAKIVITQLREELATTEDSQAKAEVQARLNVQFKIIQTGPPKAMDYFRQAISLANAETSTSEINVVRYFLCYLYFVRSDFYDAALMGEFLCRRYPDAAG